MRIFRVAKQDWDVRLECVCADDFGVGYRGAVTQEDEDAIAKYDHTREAHQRLEALADEHGIRHYVADTDDRDSRHSDAYLYFKWSQLDRVVSILKDAGVDGDILDVPPGFPVELTKRVESLGWSVE